MIIVCVGSGKVMEYKRITERIKNASGASDKYGGELVQYKYGKDKTLGQCLVDILGRLAELEDKIESGQIRILPCKLGDHIYVITRIGNFIDLDEYVVDWFDTYNIDDKNIGFCFNGKDVEDCHLEFCCYDTDFGKTAFLTRSEAEAKLKELKNK